MDSPSTETGGKAECAVQKGIEGGAKSHVNSARITSVFLRKLKE